MKHGYRLAWLGTSRLPWGDAVALVQMQPPGQSAVYRVTHPDEYDRDIHSDRLEVIAVLLSRVEGVLAGAEKLPAKWDDLFAPVDAEPAKELLPLEEIDRLMGWNREG